MPGPQIPLYTLGREITRSILVAFSDNTTIGIALFSYNGTIGFGLSGDYDTARDLGVLAEGIEKSISELTHAAS